MIRPKIIVKLELDIYDMDSLLSALDNDIDHYASEGEDYSETTEIYRHIYAVCRRAKKDFLANKIQVIKHEFSDFINQPTGG